MTNDSTLIFEAYHKARVEKSTLLKENVPPTEMGASFDTEIPHDKIPEDAGKYMKQVPEEVRGKAISIVISRIKAFITKQKGKVFLKDFKSFRNEIAGIISREFPAIDKANAGYTARKIQELLITKGILKDERNGKLRVTGLTGQIPVDEIEAKFAEMSAAASKKSGASAPAAGTPPAAP